MQVFQTSGKPLATKTLASTDSSQDLTTAYMGSTATRITLAGYTNEGAYGCLITCETADIRFAMGGATPVQSGSIIGHILAAGSSIMLDGESQVNSFKFLSKTAATPAALRVTPYLAYGR